jgi:hypothetical protein
MDPGRPSLQLKGGEMKRGRRKRRQKRYETVATLSYFNRSRMGIGLLVKPFIRQS